MNNQTSILPQNIFSGSQLKKTEIDPNNLLSFRLAVGELINKVDEKYLNKNRKSKLDNFDIFGTSPALQWRGSGTFTTKLGTIISVLFLSFAIFLLYTSFENFFALSRPSINYSNEYKEISEPHDLNKSIYPIFYLGYFSADVLTRQDMFLTLEEINCNFYVAVRSHSTSPYFDGPTVDYQLKQGCTDQINDATNTNDKLIIETRSFCIDSKKIEVYGGQEFCIDNCQYWNISIVKKDASLTASCPKQFNYDNMFIIIQNHESFLDPMNYDNPWQYYPLQKQYWLNSSSSFIAVVNYGIRKLTTEARQVGFNYGNKSTSQQRIYNTGINTEFTKTGYSAGVLVSIFLAMGTEHVNVERGYDSFLDSLSYFGGLLDLLSIGVAFLYGIYSDKLFKRE